jgi:hypothetical protein
MWSVLHHFLWQLRDRQRTLISAPLGIGAGIVGWNMFGCTEEVAILVGWIKSDYFFNSRVKWGITGMLCGKPHMASPRFELMMRKNTTNRFRGNGADNPIVYKLFSQVSTEPLGKRTAKIIRSFTCYFYYMDRYLWGEKRAFGLVQADLEGRQFDTSGTGTPICRCAYVQSGQIALRL